MNAFSFFHSRILFASLTCSLADEMFVCLSLLVVSGSVLFRAKAPRVTRSEKGYGDKYFNDSFNVVGCLVV